MNYDAPLILIPAYGRQYCTETDCADMWFSGKDFLILGGPYTSIRDYAELKKQYNYIVIRWHDTNDNCPREIVMHEVKPKRGSLDYYL